MMYFSFGAQKKKKKMARNSFFSFFLATLALKDPSHLCSS